MQKIDVRAGSGEACGQRVLQHIAAAAGVLADSDLCSSVFAAGPVIPAEIAAHLEGLLCRQIHICLSAETVCSKISAHCFLYLLKPF